MSKIVISESNQRGSKVTIKNVVDVLKEKK